MKKFLGLLSAMSLTATSSTSVVSCFEDKINLNDLITTTDLGTFYYPKGISAKNALPSEGELWTRIRELNPDFNGGFEFVYINIINIDSSTAKIVVGKPAKYQTIYLGEVMVTFKSEAKDKMQIQDIITKMNHSEYSIYPSINVGQPDNNGIVDYKSFVTKYIDKLYSKIKGIYTLEDLTQTNVKDFITVNEFPLPNGEQPLTEDYIWDCIEKYNHIKELKKENLKFHPHWDPLQPNQQIFEILGQGPQYDGKVFLYFNHQVKIENLKKQVIPNGSKIWEDHDYRDRYFKISIKPENNANISGDVIIKIRITVNNYDGI